MKHTTKTVLREYSKFSSDLGVHIWEYASPDEIKMAREIAKLRNKLAVPIRKPRPWEHMTEGPG